MCVFECVHVLVCTLTMDLQYFSGLLWRLCECHMVHFAGVCHSIIISVHMQLQRAPDCKGLPTCIHLFGTFGESSILSHMQHIHLARSEGHTPALQTRLQQDLLST